MRTAATGSPPASGLLLLEFVTSERWVFNSRFFPFIKGAAQARAIPCRWLCFGAEFHMEKAGDADVRRHMPMTPEELGLLQATIAELRPTHVLMSHVPCPAALDLLRDAGADVSLLNTEDDSSGGGVLAADDFCARYYTKRGPGEDDPPTSTRLSRAEWVSAWLGVEPTEGELAGGAPRYMVGTFVPDYEVVMGNAAARAKKPHVILMGGLACDHLHKVKRNKHYEGLDLTGCAHDFGCAYCTWYRGPNSDLSVDPVVHAEQQLVRIMETAGPRGRFCGVLDVFDVRLFSRLERFFEMVLRIDFPATTFCFEPRLDRVLAARAALERVLPRLASKGHVISVFRLGAENLVEAENELYNKHITLKQIDAARATLADLRERFPEAFEYDPTWGYITCSPWTTLEMFEEGIERAMERDFEPKGVWLYTPLLLYHGAPITALALAEGDILLDNHEELALLYEASVNQVAFSSFAPWRFKDPRMAEAFALVVRFCAAALRDKYSDAIFHGDPLYRELLAFPGLEERFERPDLFARHVVAAAGDGPHGLSALLQRAMPAYLACLPARDSAEPESAPGEHGTSDLSEPSPPDPPQVDSWELKLERIHWLARAVARRMGEGGTALQVEALGEMIRGDSFFIDIRLRGRALRLIFRRRGAEQPYLFRSPLFEISHARETVVEIESDLEPLKRFVGGLDVAVRRHLPS